MILYRAYLGLLEILGSIFNFHYRVVHRRFVRKTIKSLHNNPDPEHGLDELVAILQFGVKTKIEYLDLLPTIYFSYKISLVMEHIDMNEKEYHTLRNFYYYKKRYSMLVRYILNIKRDFKDEYEKYFELEANL